MRFSHYKRPLFLLLLLWCALIFAFERRTAGVRPAPEPPAGTVSLEGRVAQYPSVSGGLRRFVLDRLSPDTAYDGTVVMAYVREAGGASYGDRVEMDCSLSEPFNYAVPGGLDWREYLAGRGIYAEARCGGLRILEKARFPLGPASRLRDRTLEVFEKNFSPDRASVLSGMVLGEKKKISEELKREFQDSGAMHLLVASGSNVGFVTFLVYFVCSRLGVGKRCSGLAAAALSGFYVLAAGLDAPLVRGYLMFTAALAAYLLDRDPGVFQGLVIACFVILIFDRTALFDAGFQMSFTASYGITVGMALWDGLVPFKGPGRYLARVLMVSAFAQAGLYPLMAAYFHRISLVSILSNVLLVPLSGVIMGLGFAALTTSWQPLLFQAVKLLTDAALGLFLSLLKFFASFRYSSVAVVPPSVPELAGSMALALVLLHAPLLGFRRPRLYALAVLPALALLAARVTPEKSLVSAFSDRDTDSVVLRHGGSGLFIFNPGISGEKLAGAALYYGRRKAEGVFVSSLSRRDWSGLAVLAGTMEIGRVFVPYGVRSAELGTVLDGLSAAGIRVERVWPGDRITFPGLEVRAVRRAGRSGSAGYTGLGERLDWEISAGGFRVSVLAGGSRISAARPPGKERVLEVPAGRTAELEL